MLPSDFAHITNTQNEGVLCQGGTKWWEQLKVSEEEVFDVLTARCDMQVRNIRTVMRLRQVYRVIQVIN